MVTLRRTIVLCLSLPFTVAMAQAQERSAGAGASTVVQLLAQMTDPAPKTQNWKAWQNVQPGGRPKLIVVGQVEVAHTNQLPELVRRIPQGFNPTILMLVLEIAASGTGDAVATWRDVRFEEDISKDQYVSIDVLWGGQIIGQAKVETAQ